MARLSDMEPGVVDDVVEPAEDEAGEPGSADEGVRTGDAAVDSVLDQVEGLDELPVEEHVAVFERAHEDLRSALDRPGDQD